MLEWPDLDLGQPQRPVFVPELAKGKFCCRGVVAMVSIYRYMAHSDATILCSRFKRIGANIHTTQWC